MQKTYQQKSAEVSHKWLLIDASQAPLGRLATVIANYLIGKSKPTYTPHIDDGDYVVVINSDKLVVTGNKAEDKIYYRHSGYPGSLKSASLNELRVKDSTKIIHEAVKGMLPKNKLAAERIKRLKIYVDENHQHAPQQPVKVEITPAAKAKEAKK